MKADSDRQKLVREAKAIVALTFRNGIMKNAVDRVSYLLSLRDQDPEKYESQMRFGERYTAKWDDPEMP